MGKKLTAPIKGSLKSGVLRLIQLDRQSDHLSMFSDETHRDLIAKLIHVMLALGLYKQDFEPDFLQETTSFFQKDSTEKLNVMDLAGYLNYVDNVLKDELHRVQECMDISTKRMVLDILQKELIEAHKSEILTNKDFSRFIIEGKVFELQMMHSQLKRVNGSLELRKTWASHLKLRGEELIKEEIVTKKSFRVVEDILEFKKRQEDLLTKVFIDKEDHDLFKLVIKESFEHFLNLNSNVMSEFLAKFLDMHLKKTSTLGSDEALEDLTN